jgi:hypothetical protein
MHNSVGNPDNDIPDLDPVPNKYLYNVQQCTSVAAIILSFQMVPVLDQTTNFTAF